MSDDSFIANQPQTPKGALNSPTQSPFRGLGRTKLIPYLLALTGALLFLPFLGKVHLFDWDEINFAECAREMIVAKKYFFVTINYLPFWEKPPLFIWMQALCMNIFGISDYAARLPNAICGIATFVVLYKIGTLCKDSRFGLLWVLAYAGSLLPHFYFKSGIIDPWFNFFIFTGVYFFMRVQMQKKELVAGKSNLFIILSACLLGLAIITKGPVALLIFSLCLFIYWLIEKRRAVLNFGQLFLFLLVLLASGGLWFGAEIATGHSNVIMEFINYQIRLFKTEDSGHGGPFYFHVIILLIGCFPASIFAFRGMSSEMKDDEKGREVSLWMGLLFWVTLILFSIVKTKIIHYSSLCYYPLTYFAALAMSNLLDGDVKWRKWMSWGLGITGGLIAIALIGLPIAGMNAQAIINSGILKDPFAAANLQADIHWSFADCLLGIFLLVTLISAIIFLQKGKIQRGILTMFLGSLITTNLALAVIAPKIELLTQQSAVEFYQSLQGKNVYVTTLGFKSYAHYFYSAEQPLTNIHNTDDAGWRDWLLKGDIDKPAYFVCKINNIDDWEKWYPQLKEINRKNGFVFLERAVVIK
jgi:4-amino-4-deoxy-L-arabinose transferase-like glycosyltransferase